MTHIQYLSLFKGGKKSKSASRPFARRQIDARNTLQVVSDLEKESSGTSYIPVSIAREQISRVVSDMQSIKQYHSMQLEDLNMHIQAAEQRWKTRAKEKLTLYRQKTSNSFDEYENRISTLKGIYSESEQVFKRRFEVCLMQQEDISHWYQRRLEESSRLLEVCKLQKEDIIMLLIKQSEEQIDKQAEILSNSLSLKHQRELKQAQAVLDKLVISGSALTSEISKLRTWNQQTVSEFERERVHLHQEGILNVTVRQTVSHIMDRIAESFFCEQSHKREKRLTFQCQNAINDKCLYLTKVEDLEDEVEALKHQISSFGRKTARDTLDQMVAVISSRDRQNRLLSNASEASQTEEMGRHHQADAWTSCDLEMLNTLNQTLVGLDDSTKRLGSVDIGTETASIAIAEDFTQTETYCEEFQSDSKNPIERSKVSHGEEPQLRKDGQMLGQQVEKSSIEVHQAEKKASVPRQSTQAKPFVDSGLDTSLLEKEGHSKEMAQLILNGIEKGKRFWNSGDRKKCFETYFNALTQCSSELSLIGATSKAAECEKVLEEAPKYPLAKAALILREQLNEVSKSNEEKSLPIAEAKSPQRQSKRSTKKQAPLPESVKAGPSFSGSLQMNTQKVESLEELVRTDKLRIAQLEAMIAAMNQVAAQATREALNEPEKNENKKLENDLQATRREMETLSKQLQDAYSHCKALEDQIKSYKAELAIVSLKGAQLVQMQAELNAAQSVAAEASKLSCDLKALQMLHATLEVNYREEQKLRKKYYNQVEDLKGKIRVFARCRPISKSESERKCEVCVSFPNDMTISLQTSRGAKEFVFDQVFSPDSTQEQVFEDTQHLIQSTIDGYNVCIFAYGQTGSGKTFTMTGSDTLPGLSPRAIRHLFSRIAEVGDQYSITLQAYMIELYNDSLIDLFALVDGHPSSEKLDIKKNDKGLVYVQNATIKACTSAQQTLRLFDQANQKRQVGATKMNAESSRSHSVLSILVQATHKSNKVTTTGKMSLVDLAGSERAGKTGATADRLKEAQAINKSLSALGDVIAALSSNEKFIPYRNNKLTQLMQDSLGGNAKTLMFVNISPADYNQEETQTSLQYASRVKLITNSANKNADSERVNALKTIIKQLRAGKTDIEYEGLID
ncbi:hypothetical protein ABG067_005750 [Albugo candida]